MNRRAFVWVGSLGQSKSVKLDAKFTGTITKAKDGSTVPDDEWMVFLAKDDAFPATLAYYRDRCVALGCDDAHIAAIDRTIDRVNIWRAANRDRCKRPDAKGEKLLDVPDSPSGGANPWQPIETAPGDGRAILVWDALNHCSRRWRMLGSSPLDIPGITHWMPDIPITHRMPDIPPPPSDQNDASKGL